MSGPALTLIFFSATNLQAGDHDKLEAIAYVIRAPGP